MIIRPRRLRKTGTIREMVRETRLSTKDFIAPLFVKHGKNVRDPILSMPGQFQFSPDTLVEEAKDTVGHRCSRSDPFRPARWKRCHGKQVLGR